MVYPDYWTCPQCQTVVSNSSYCTNCAYQPQPQKTGYPDYWTCPKCNSVVRDSPACTTCQYNPSVTTEPEKKSKGFSVKSFIKSKTFLVISVGGIILLSTLLLTNLLSLTVRSEQVETEAQEHFNKINDRLDFIKECDPNWECTEWESCTENSPVQERECIDLNECNTTYFKPMTKRLCD